ncbi:hypothetical protein P9139_09870 [Curtobacterium flaccumfaciens]|nr:hypothetical protein P9139_09870 [Curtobacterium flaccumfaciens]
MRLVLGLVPYQVFLAAAAVRAVVRHARKQNGWEKTEHTGQHRTAGQPAEVVGFANAVATRVSDSPDRSDDRQLAGSTAGAASTTGGTR